MMRIYFLAFFVILVSVSYIFCDVDFDYKVQNVDTLIQVKIFGYRNLKNRGVFKGCCGNVTKRICKPCRMMIVIEQSSWYSDPEDIKNTTVAVFSKESNELYEKFEKNWIFNSYKYAYVKLSIYNMNFKSIVQEEFMEIYSSTFTTYKYDGAYGRNNILELWAEIILLPNIFKYPYHISMMRIDSLYFKEFRNFDQQCCNGEFEDVCDEDCTYYINWSAEYTLDSSNDLSPISNNRQQNISYTLTNSYSSGTFKLNADYTLTIKSTNNYKIIDSIKISKINDLPNIEYKLINLEGIYGNVIFNISWMHSCQGYGGINCQNKCTADLGTEYCDTVSDNSKCLNGASDPNTCINLPTQCKQDTCNNRGICMLIQGIAKCNCEPGYTGKFCQDFQCDSGCNGNGRCIGPNECSCNPPNSGKDCEEYPCDEEIGKKCGLYGHCKISDGIVQCECFNKFFKGENCSEAICDQDCIFGKCVYNKRLDMTNCVCNELYQGVTCNITIKILDQTNARAKLSATVAVIVIALIALIVTFVLIYMNIIKLNFTKFNLFTLSEEGLQIETAEQWNA